MIASIIRLLTGVHSRWDGIEPLSADGNIQRRIYFANHGSNLDAPVIWASLPRAIRATVRPVAAKDYWMAKPWRRYVATKVFHAVLIERHHVSRSNNPMVAMEQAMEAGSSLIIFPEGSRVADDDGEIGTFKPGLWHLAKRFPAVPLVPVYLENLNRILPRGELLMVPLIAAVTFGPPVFFEAEEDKSAFLERVKSALLRLRSPDDASERAS